MIFICYINFVEKESLLIIYELVILLYVMSNKIILQKTGDK